MSESAAALLAVCRRLVDPHARPITLHAAHNGTFALRAVTATGEVIVKLHRGPDRHHQEVHAYTHWTTALQGHAPRLLAVSDDPPGIVITALPGGSLADASLPVPLEAAAYRQAGAILRTLHSAAPPVDEPNMSAWLAERGERWLAHAHGLVPLARRTEIRAHLRALGALGTIPAVPCHLDYTPRNLLCSGRESSDLVPTIHRKVDPDIQAKIRVSTFDFEHGRYDLAARVWRNRPDLKEAFLHGYGPLSALDRQVIEHCSYLDSLTAVVRVAQRVRIGLDSR